MDPAGGPARRPLGAHRLVGESLVAADHQELAGGLAAVGVGGVVPATRIRESCPSIDRVVRGATHAATAHVHRDHAVRPVRGVGNPLVDPDVVDGVSGGVQLEASHPIRVRRILGVQDVVTASRGEGVDVVLGDEDVVDTAGELVVVTGDHGNAVQRIADVEDHEPVLPVRSSLHG